MSNVVQSSSVQRVANASFVGTVNAKWTAMKTPLPLVLLLAALTITTAKADPYMTTDFMQDGNLFFLEVYLYDVPVDGIYATSYVDGINIGGGLLTPPNATGYASSFGFEWVDIYINAWFVTIGSHSVSYFIETLSGNDVWVHGPDYVVQSPEAAVPEAGATAGLLAAALAVCGMARRRFMAV
jgi:hypothetical protein